MAKRSRKMRSRKKRSRKKRPQRVPTLSDDLIVNILSLVLYRSLCRMKCVSKAWLAICSDPELHKKSPQSLSGFFCYYRTDDINYPSLRLCFLNLSGRGRPLVDPSSPSAFPLLEGYMELPFMQCSSSLLLRKFIRTGIMDPTNPRYLVSNPATQKWTMLPTTGLRHQGVVSGLEIYSSQTGGWVFMQSDWGDDTTMDHLQIQSVFFRGTLYATTTDLSVVTVDTEGKTWRKIRKPHSYIQHDVTNYKVFIAHSQGRFYTVHIDSNEDNQLSVWALDDDCKEQWTLMHTAKISKLLVMKHRRVDRPYRLIAVHPERNLIFFSGWSDDDEQKLFSYNVDNNHVCVISHMEDYSLALPYIPCFAECGISSVSS